jgi:CubicO group peptidase (beta-lactamase class C family)
VSPHARGAPLVAALFAALAGCAAGPPATAPAEPARPFDAAFDEVMARYRLPGLAVGIVVGDEIVYVRTAGETIAGSGQPITPDTIFKIASNGKAMTTGLLARLVDAGKLRWDDPVIRHLPGFRMHDPWVTREMQVRDLLIHNSGLPAGAGDLMLWPEPNQFTRADIIAALAHLVPASSFRSSYDYDNLLYIVAGEVAAAAAGTSYEDLLRQELFVPLAMHRCRAGEWRRDEVGNVAQPHMRRGDTNAAIRLDDEVIPTSTAAAAGGIRCSLHDMLKWVRMWLHPDLTPAPGAPAWLTRAQRDALWTPHMPLPLSARQRRWDNGHFHAYGYGWRLSDVDGRLRVAHTGTLTGMYSAVVLLPEKRAGFVILVNGDGGEARNVLSQVLVKHFTAPGEALSVSTYADELARERERRFAASTSPPGSPAPTAPPPREPVSPADMQAWLGTYRDPWFGEVSICKRDTGVEFAAAKSPRLTGRILRVGRELLVDWHDESVDAEPWLLFGASSRTEPVTLRLAKVDPDADFSYDFEDLSFTRTGACQ